MLKSIKFTSLIYYIILLVVLVSWTKVESLPPLPLRMVYMLAVIFPLWIKKSLLFPQVFFTFVIISASLPAVSYMPVDSLYILIVSIISYLLINPKFSNIRLPSSFIVLTVLSLVIDGIFSANCMLSYALMCVMLIARFIPKDNETILKSFIAVFVLVSLVLSSEFVLLGKRFVQSVATQVGQLDRSGWTDPNYFGSIIGYGVVTSSIALFKWQKMKKKYRWFLLGTIIVSLYTILITASRGVFVALAISMLFLILFSNISKKRKLVYLGSGVFIVFLFYALGVLDLLLLRFQSDAGDAGGRMQIWMPRLNSFFSDSNIFELFFGVGTKQSLFVGTYKLLGSHNDYIAIVVRYGIVGLLSLLTLILSPIIKAKRNKGCVIAAVVYISVCMFSIEPFSAGQWSLLCFYLFIVILSQLNHEEVKI